MARTHARVYHSIWADPDFLARTESAQRMFLFLLSQSDIEHSGVLGLRERRWSRGASDSTLASIEKALAELIESRFIVVDEDTEEVLVRSFMRWDNVWRQPNIAKAAAEHIRTLTSVPIRAALLAELQRIEISGANMQPHIFAEVRQLREDLLNELNEAIPNPTRNPSGKGSGNPSANGSANPRAKGSGEGGNCSSEGQPPSPTTSPSTSTAPTLPLPAVAAAPATGGGLTVTQRSKVITDAYAAAEPMCKWPAVNGVVIKAIRSERYTDDEIRDALLRLAAEGRGVTVETLRTELNGFPPRDNGQRLAQH